MSTQMENSTSGSLESSIMVFDAVGSTRVAHRIPKNVVPTVPDSLEAVARSYFFIRRLHLDAKLGLDDWERAAVQPLEADVKYTLPHGRSCLTDRLEDTVDHLTVAQKLRSFAVREQHELLQQLAFGMIDLLQNEFGFPWISLALTKRRPHPVIAEGITLERGVRPTPGGSLGQSLWGAEG